MKFLKDMETKVLKNEDEIREYVDFRSKNDIWKEVPIQSCIFIGINNETDVIVTANNYNTSFTSEEDLKECVKDTGIFLILPNEGEKDFIIPLRYTAMESAFNRAGIAGHTIHNTDEKPNAQILSVKEKAAVLTKFCSLYGADTKILIRDGKASFMASPLYSILPEKDLFEIIKDIVDFEYPTNEFKTGTISHESFNLHYLFHDEDMESDMENRLKDYGYAVDKVESGFMFHTSDVGELSASVHPYFMINDTVKLCCGVPISVKHIGKNSTKDFEKALQKMNSLFKNSTQHFDKLAQMDIKYPDNCLMQAVDHLKLPKKIATKVAENLIETYPCGCTGFAIYWALCEIVNEYASQDKIKVERVLFYQETVARAVEMNFKRFDNLYGVDVA